MPLQQLYYTSCGVGLSGFAGWQFNAVSAAVSTDLMRDVEALTAYQAPRSMMYSDAPEDLARCPVNLCFVPGEPADTAVAACVRYVGRDSSRRFGNYFAHALSGGELAAGPLPIELWDSPVWTTTPADTTRLPELNEAPAAGPLTAASVQHFVAEHPHGDRLFQLLAATVRALREERTVVVVENGTDAVAHWFSAVCALLPPGLARTVSFATYPKRPDRSRLRLVGTLPEVWHEADPEGEQADRVFDFAAGRFPDTAMPPLARLLERVGLPAARTFWSWAAEYAAGHEKGADDWYPPAVAAAASGGTLLEAVDIAALIDWLDRSHHLDRPTRAGIARDAYRFGPLSAEQLTVLRATAQEVDDQELTERLEGDLLELGLRRYMAGDADAAPQRPFAELELRARATALWLDVLETADVDESVRLLLWADRSGLDPDRQALLRKSTWIARELLATAVTAPPDAAARQRLRDAAARWAQLRQGMVCALTAQLDAHPNHFPELLHGVPSDILTEADLQDAPELREAYLLAHAEKDPGRAPAVLRRILELRGPAVPLAAPLLKNLWPGGRWNHAQALEVARSLPPGQRVDPTAGDWFGSAVRREPDSVDDIDRVLELAELLLAPQRVAWLDPDTQRCARELLRLTEALSTKQGSTVLARLVLGRRPALWRSYEAVLGQYLPTALATCTADPRDIAALLDRMPSRMAENYLRAESRTLGLTSGPDASGDHVNHALGLVRGWLTADPVRQATIDGILKLAVQRWPLDDIEALAHAVRPYHPRYAERLLHQVEEKRLTLRKKVGRTLGKLPLVGRAGKDRPDEPEQPADGRRPSGRDRADGRPDGPPAPAPRREDGR